MISPARLAARADRAGGGLGTDLGLYALGAVFAAVTAYTSTLDSHRAWGALAWWGYAAAGLVAAVQLLARARAVWPGWTGTAARAVLAGAAWAATAVLPLVVLSAQRAGGRTDRAQEEVLVVEQGAARFVEHGTPYLSRPAIAALPEPERLLGYLPYQPGMAGFGLPRVWFGPAWWTDARIWFAFGTATALALALAQLRGRGAGPALVRAAQAATVLPVCALTLATGGDDLPVLALCLLALASWARGRYATAGVAIGVAGALKLFAWPVTLVLLVLAVTRGRRAAGRFALGALGLPLAALVPTVAVDRGAALENLLLFPLGRGLIESPAASPFPGYLIANGLPGGRGLAAGLLLAAGAAIAVALLRRPPTTAARAARFGGYGLLTAILLMPSTRFGYLLYPIALLVWAPALRRTEQPQPAPVPEPASGPAPEGVHLTG